MTIGEAAEGGERASRRAPSLARRAAMFALACAVALGCGRRAAAPLVPEPPPVVPPSARVEAVHPPARGTGVLYDTEVWVRFATALDTTTISGQTVYFKADTRRLAITLAWEPATRRLRIVPLERLALRKTYTVELTGALGFADGGTLGQPYISQFTTNSLRRVQSPLPMNGRREQSPFVALRWGGLTEASAGPVSYEIHVESDSALAADPTRPPLGARLTPLFVPRVRWRQDGPSYWSIHALNAATGERLAGPVWRFEALPAGAPYDSVLAVFSDFDWMQSNRVHHCSGNVVQMGSDVTCVFRWNLGLPDSTVRMAGVAIEFSPLPGISPPGPDGPSVWLTSTSWVACDIRWSGPPFTDEAEGRLADAVALRPDRIRFSGDALTAHVEATRRLGGFYGYLFRSGTTRVYYAPFTAQPNPMMWLYTYRRSPG